MGLCLPLDCEVRSMKTLRIVLFMCMFNFVISEDQCNLTLKTNPLYIFLGEQTILTCTLYRFRTFHNISENHVSISKWNKQNLSISSFVIDDDNSTVTAHAQDVVSINSVPERVGIVWYLCTSPLCEGKTARRYLNIENRPVKVSNGSCLVYNWQNMTCAWDLGVIYRNTRDVSVTVQYNDTVPDFTHLDYDVTLHWSVYSHLSPCKNMRLEGKCLTCEMMENDDRESYKRGTYMFVVNITNRWRPEANVSSRFYFNTDELVQPAKVENVVIQVNKTEINLLWSHSKPYVSLQFRIEYKSQWENDWKESNYSREIDDFDLRNNLEINARLTHDEEQQAIGFSNCVVFVMKPTKEMGLQLTDLTPYTLYDIRISCIPIVSGEVKGFWSETVMTNTRTLEDVPSAVPVVQPSFFNCMDTECSEIQIYWQPIKEEDKRCNMMRYKVEAESPKSPHSRPVYATQDAVSAKLPLNTNATNYVRVVPFNEKTSEFPKIEPSVIVIPPKLQWPIAPVHLEAISDGEDSKRVTLTWSYPDHFREKPFNGDFTVVWCKKSAERICQKEFHWLGTVVNTTVEIELSNGSTVDDYIYGIAADGYFGGVRSSSGIVWADCVHFTNRTISEKLYVRSIMDEIDQGVMKIAWNQYKCKEFRGQVVQYTITYCAVRNCKDTTQSLNISKNERNHTIRGLAPDKYRLWVGAVSDAGSGPTRQIEFLIYKKQNSLGRNEIIAAAIGIVLGILVIIALIMMLSYCVWKHLRTSRKDEIELPVILKEGEIDDSKNSQTTSGRKSVRRCSDSSESDNIDSTGTHDSGGVYQPLEVHSSDPVLNKSYLSSRYRNSQLSQTSDEFQQLTKTDDEDDRSVGSELYSMEDINTVLDQDCDKESNTGQVTSNGSLPEYVPPATNTFISKNQEVIYNCDYITSNMDFSK